MLDYKLLESLARVAEEGGFDKAARRLNITQSAVSQRIRLLEDQAGMVLLTRTLPPAPTKEGRELIKHYLKVRQLEGDLSTRLMLEGVTSFRTLALGINADSLATWFYPAVESLLEDRKVLLDLRVDDQDETHKLLRKGEVLGCISSLDTPVQGCRISPLGTMNYRMVASPAFREAWFPKGIVPGCLDRVPAVIFNRVDDLHYKFLEKKFNRDSVPELPIHYIPSPEAFVKIIVSGKGYGMLPDLQSMDLLEKGCLVDLAPDTHIRVPLYWHRWNLGSFLLDEFSKAIVQNAVIC
ncbi:MAG: LysR family transcriptional regulator ArgP [Desulfobacter sp.]|nr:MAG: LysR family transcriptional regulator ArgP [Desulfobacter sp.]